MKNGTELLSMKEAMKGGPLRMILKDNSAMDL